MTCLKYKHPLQYNGTHQKDRLPAALLPENLIIDGRSTRDFLRFAHDFADLIKYYNLNDQEHGNWQCFFNGGFLGILSIITAIDLDEIDNKYCRAELGFWTAIAAANDDEKEEVRRQNYQILIDCIFDLAQQLLTLCQRVPANKGLRQEILDIIRQDLLRAVIDNRIRNPLKVLIAYDKANRPLGDQQHGLNDPLAAKYEDFIQQGQNNSNCVKIWDIDGLDEFFCITPDDGYKEEQPTGSCLENRKLRQLFFFFYQALAKIINRAEAYLLKELEHNEAQEPHIGLFIAFIWLFRRLLRQFNQLAESHLDFYYQQVLCLPNNPFTPDQVFVAFELAKNVNNFPLKAGNPLDAKKDDEGNRMSYQLDNDIFVGRAKVEACDALYLKADPKGGYEQLYTINGTQAGDTKETVINWERFRDSNLENFDAQEVGIAISDPTLNLREGTRFIVVTMEVEEDLPSISIGAINSLFKLYLSSDLAEGGWLAVPPTRNRAAMHDLEVPSNEPDAGLTRNIQHRRIEDEIPSIINNYENLDQAGFSVTFLAEQKIEIRILLKESDFPINLPSEGDPVFQQAAFPLLKLTFNVRLNDLLQVNKVKNIRIVTESYNVKKEVSIRNQLGTFNNENTFPLLAQQFLDDNGRQSVGIDIGAFVEFNLAELKGKQILGLEPAPDFLDQVNTGGALSTPLPNQLIKYSDNNARFSASYRIFDDFVGYNQLNPNGFLEVPHLPKLGDHRIGLIRTLTLPIPIQKNISDFTSELKERMVRRITGVAADQVRQARAVQRTQILENITARSDLRSTGTTLNPSAQTPAIPGTQVNPPPRRRDIDGNLGQDTEVLINRRNPIITTDFSELILLPGTKNNPEPLLPGFGFQTLELPGLNANSPFSSNFNFFNPCIVYSALRNQNVLSLIYQLSANTDSSVEPSDFFQKHSAQVKRVAFRYSAYADLYTESGGVVYRKFEFNRYYITPGGFNFINPNRVEEAVPIIPRYHVLQTENNDIEIQNEQEETATIGHLDIGIRELQPGQQLSLLFIMEEGTGNTNFDPPEVQWSYLTKDNDGLSDEWKPFREGAIFFDGTKADPNSENSLLQSGIIKFTTSPTMTGNSTTKQPGSGLYWIRATVIERQLGQRIIALPNIKSIVAQAESATFQNQNNTLNHLNVGLPAETITKLVNQVPALKKVKQPLPSQGGGSAEDRNAYYRRVSERLRHKDRAVNIWDYERIILEAFPEVIHAKTLSHTSKNCEIDPGKVLVAVFPDLINRPDINPFKPGLSIGKLEAIEGLLRTKANLFLYCDENIQVVNPFYDLIKVKCCVRFRQGVPPLLHVAKLNEDLHGFLAPWLVDPQTDIHFSGSINKSAILNFMEEREYVDVVSSFEVFHFTLDMETNEPISTTGLDILGNPLPIQAETIQAFSARSILSTFFPGHDITLWGGEGCDDCLAPNFSNFQIC